LKLAGLDPSFKSGFGKLPLLISSALNNLWELQSANIKEDVKGIQRVQNFHRSKSSSNLVLAFTIFLLHSIVIFPFWFLATNETYG
jgi:hypothetical protein